MTSSLPPHLLRVPGSKPGTRSRGRNWKPPGRPPTPPTPPAKKTAQAAVRVPGRLQVIAGEPGAYDVDLAPADRPRNLQELAAVAEPADRGPWPAGSYVLLGASGRRAHWTGSEWRGNPSPGYPAVMTAAPDRSEPEQSQMLVATDEDAAGESLPDAPGQDGPDHLEDARKPSGGAEK